MTHDELLDKIYWHWRYVQGNDGLQAMTDYRKALLAIADLHKPDVRGNCDICSWVSGGFVVYSVCPTIKAIEKELV